VRISTCDMQASQLFLLRAYRNRGIDLIRTNDVEMVDKRLQQLYKALASSLELEHWKFELAIKDAIAGSDQSFARLCQAAEGLASLVCNRALVHNPE
jgi:Holliday junction resolvasome RuvABC endonuclease subunit